MSSICRLCGAPVSLRSRLCPTGCGPMLAPAALVAAASASGSGFSRLAWPADAEQSPALSGAAVGGLGRRLAAYGIDVSVLSLAVYALYLFAWGSPSTANAAEHLPELGAVSFGLAWLYFALLESSALEATIGKWALGLRVCSELGCSLGFTQASGRYLATAFSWMTFGVGFLMIGLTDRGQGCMTRLRARWCCAGLTEQAQPKSRRSQCSVLPAAARSG